MYLYDVYNEKEMFTFHTSIANKMAGALYHVPFVAFLSHASSTSIQWSQSWGKSFIRDSLLAIASFWKRKTSCPKFVQTVVLPILHIISCPYLDMTHLWLMNSENVNTYSFWVFKASINSPSQPRSMFTNWHLTKQCLHLTIEYSG